MHELLEVVEGRQRIGPLIICSQFSLAEWNVKLGEGAIADAVIDRVVYRSDIIAIIQGNEVGITEKRSVLADSVALIFS